MSLVYNTVTTEPAAEPVSTSEAKAYMRVDFADDDTLIAALITAARQWVQGHTGIVPVSTVFEAGFTCDSVVPGTVLQMPVGPVSAVSAVSYRTSSGFTAVSSSDYTVQAYRKPGAVFFRVGFGLQVSSEYGEDAWKVNYTAGYANAAACPENLKLAIKMLVAHWYDRRGITAEAQQFEIPMTIKHLLGQVRSVNV